MNPRIRELAEQSGLEFIYDPTETPMRAFVEGWETDLKKFSELIVEECMDVVSKKCASLTAYNALVEHFGVEE